MPLAVRNIWLHLDHLEIQEESPPKKSRVAFYKKILSFQSSSIFQIYLSYQEGFRRVSWLGLGLSTTLTSEDKNDDFETSLKVKNKDYILMYNGLGAKIDNISTNEVVYPINHFYAL